MAARKNFASSTQFTFKVGEVTYKVLPGTSRDFLSMKPKEGAWSIMSEGETAAVVAALEAQVGRLKASD